MNIEKDRLKDERTLEAKFFALIIRGCLMKHNTRVNVAPEQIVLEKDKLKQALAIALNEGNDLAIANILGKMADAHVRELETENVELREQLERVNKLGEEMLRRLEVVAGIEPSADHGWYYVMGEVERQVAALHQLTEATDDGMKLILKRAGLNKQPS